MTPVTFLPLFRLTPNHLGREDSRRILYAGALRTEGLYSQRRIVYHIERRVRRLRAVARRIERNGSSS
jgi:hypothetical protein